MGGAGRSGDGLRMVSRVSLMGFVYKIGEIRTASSVVAEWLGLLYVEQNVSGSNFTVKFNFFPSDF